MGRAKQLMEEQHAELQHVVIMLLKHKAITECPVHDGFYIDEYDGEAADTVRQELQATYGHSKEEADDLVLSALGEAGDECSWCVSNADRD